MHLIARGERGIEWQSQRRLDWCWYQHGIDMLNDRATGKCGRNSHGIQNVDGHQETTTSISPPAGYSPFNAFGIIPNGNRNNSLFMQTHYNGVRNTLISSIRIGAVLEQLGKTVLEQSSMG